MLLEKNPNLTKIDEISYDYKINFIKEIRKKISEVI
jgi:hypothetical protein